MEKFHWLIGVAKQGILGNFKQLVLFVVIHSAIFIPLVY